MNRSILQIRKEHTNKCLFNKQVNNVFFRYKEVVSLKASNAVKESLVDNKNNIFKKIIDKLDNHSNTHLELIDNKSDNLKNVYLTCNTSEFERKTSELVGQVWHKGLLKNQYVNLNHQLYTTDKSDFLFKRNLKFLERDNKINDLLINSDKIPIIEDKLNNGYLFFVKCLKHTQKASDCYQTLLMDYGEHANIINTLIFNDMNVFF